MKLASLYQCLHDIMLSDQIFVIDEQSNDANSLLNSFIARNLELSERFQRVEYRRDNARDARQFRENAFPFIEEEVPDEQIDEFEELERDLGSQYRLRREYKAFRMQIAFTVNKWRSAVFKRSEQR